jgi:hypothetical protein
MTPPKVCLHERGPLKQRLKQTLVSGTLGCRRVRDWRNFHFGQLFA